MMLNKNNNDSFLDLAPNKSFGEKLGELFDRDKDIIDRKSFKENLKEIHQYRKEQWKGLKVHDFMDEGFEAVEKYMVKPFVAAEVLLYNSFFKALVDTYIRRKKK